MTKTKETKNAEKNAGCGNEAISLGTEVLNSQTFNFMGKNVRVVMKDNEPWFVASDVCDVLGLQNPTKSISSLDEDERSNFKLGRQGDANTISEAGMYTLALRSRKPQAKPFRRWVTHEVLPAINRTGSYAIPQTQLQTAAQIIDQICDDPITCTVLSTKIAARIKPSIVTDIALQASREALLLNTTRINKIDHDVERIARNQLDISRQLDDLNRQIRELKRPAKNYRIVAVEAI
ncbi:MAG TPA: Bro-N domain-containing protein [Methanocorpusculum sp.]|nr:Bro-N domain-containing protein [Methanocorpusculum sp.]HJK04283.1 Bro-N domain-containing protein [Methanocorpusculum sp.]HJK05624.1 Bro-N domain-containing protein [Methanocorpusculum sp.]HJK11223.1 Bro-N domain-containing protein [Methanocorpusculum sp.]HJK14582.1 Bro-N domain-containing protein [Methanocorpusculum sp.]